MADSLKGKRIAIVATDGFEQAELLEPRKALEAQGAKVEVIAPKSGEIQGMEHHDKGQKVHVDRTIDEVKSEDYAALVLPGGVANPDALRTIPKVVSFIKNFFDAEKPVAVICHGPWTLVEAGVVKGRTMTSWPSLKTDLTNAGATWVDEEVVIDRGLITSRKPDDIPAFNRAIHQEFGKARQAGRQAK
jgi:protease I